MKKTAKVTALITLLFSTFIGWANEPKISTDSSDRSLVFKMIALQGETTVRLIDAQRQVIYSEDLEAQSDYAKRFDLSKLPLGSYYLEVEDTVKELTYTISLDAGKMEVTKSDEENKPVFYQKNDKVMIHLLNLDGDEVDIFVYDSDGRKLFSERNTREQIVQKAFNFENAYSDEYTIVVHDGKKTYYEEFVVE